MSVFQAFGRVTRAGTLAIGLIALAPAAYGQQPSAAAMATAKELITVNGATAVFSPLIAGVVEQAKLLFLQQNPGLAKDLNEISAQIRTDLAPRFSELTNEVATLYATHFTEDELKAILAFYESPVGKKLLVTQPRLIDSSMKFAGDWANKLSGEVTAKMRAELQKRGHAL